MSVRVNRKWPGNLEELKVYLPACSQRLGLGVGVGEQQAGGSRGARRSRVVCHQL